MEDATRSRLEVTVVDVIVDIDTPAEEDARPEQEDTPEDVEEDDGAPRDILVDEAAVDVLLPHHK